MKIALLTTDNREMDRAYAAETPRFGTAPEALLQGFAELPEIEIHVVSCTRQPMRSPSKLAANIFFHSLLVPRIGWMRTGYQGCIRAVRQKLREIAPDLVHGQGTERDCAISAVFSGYPNVLTVHGNMRQIANLDRSPPLSFHWLAARLETFTLPRANGVICLSDYTWQTVQSLAKKTWLVPNAVDREFFEIIRRPVQPRQLLVVAGVDRRKNQNAYIRALDGLPDEKPFELIFLGRAQPEEAYAREFFQLVAERRWARHAGFADRTGLRQYLATATALILPSLEDNCPMAVLEAMAAGVPVAAARVGGIPELVRDGETGLLFDPADALSMAAATRHIMEEPARAYALSAQKEARLRFHPEVIARKHLGIYREVLAAAAG